MASTLSNNFNVTINRYTPPPTNPKKVIESNNFNVTINRATSPSYVNPRCSAYTCKYDTYYWTI